MVSTVLEKSSDLRQTIMSLRATIDDFKISVCEPNLQMSYTHLGFTNFKHYKVIMKYLINTFPYSPYFNYSYKFIDFDLKKTEGLPSVLRAKYNPKTYYGQVV